MFSAQTRRRTIHQLAVAALFGALTLLGSTGCAIATPAPAPTTTTASSGAPTSAPDTGERPPVAVFLGDSFSAALGTSGASRWTQIASEQLGWVENSFALSGVGFYAASDTANVGRCEREICPSFEDDVDRVIASHPDIVVVAGGYNDAGLMDAHRQEIDAAITATFTELRAGLPDAWIVAVTPIAAGGPVDSNLATVIEWVELAANSVDASVISGADQWLTDQPDVHGEDGFHPNESGQRLLASEFVAAIESF